MYFFMGRDKASEWKAIRGAQSAGEPPFAVVVEAVVEGLRSIGKTKSNSPDAVMTQLALRVAQLESTSWIATDVDNLLVDLSASDVALLVPLLGRFAGAGVLVPRPVVRTSTPPVVRSALYDLASRLGQGLVVRVDGVTHLDQSARSAAAIALESGISAEEIHLVIDAKDLPRYVPLTELHDTIELARTAQSWTIAAGTFPASITHLSPDTLLHNLDRSEWESYNEQVAQLGGRRIPNFGDFATQSASYTPSAPFQPSPSVRYTTTNGFLLLRGRRNAPEGSRQYIGHSRVLQTLAEFGSVTDGPAEDYIRRIASGLHSTGNPAKWREASLTRHLAVATRQEAQVRSAVR